ncbi:hypothetical protein Tco_1379150 [Tanacetum coccineum]
MEGCFIFGEQHQVFADAQIHDKDGLPNEKMIATKSLMMIAVLRISYALTKKPEIYISFIKQFWRTAEASTDTDGEVTITAIIDGQSKTITEASLRRHLKLEDHDEYHLPTPNESPLHAVHSHGSDEGSKGFHQVIDFLSQSHISYALTKKPEIYISFIKQFGRIVEASTNTDGEVTITAIIDGKSKTITEASLRRHLMWMIQDGITSIPNSKIFEQLALISPKKTAWEQFSSNIATALICLATNRKYNFSRLIFEHMVTNIGSPHKFLMYPRKRIFKKRIKKKAKKKQNQARNEKDKVLSHPSEENTT